jgi:signal transduction protein with GAF and PtsI domain
MTNASQSSVQAAIAAIIEREQRDGTVPAEYISGVNRAWINRNLNKHLEPVFEEVARKIDLDKNKLDEAVARHEQEVTQYLKQREAETEKNFAALAKIYREGLANRKAALELAAKPQILRLPSRESALYM